VQVKLPSGEGALTFADAIDRLTDHDTDKILLAVSGGPDSLALLLLATATIPSRIIAATVDHGLRPEAHAEAEYVAHICSALGIAHSILRPNEPILGNIQSGARLARYALLKEQALVAGCSYIATAHHADDQLETLLMRIARGSGVDGLAAIRERHGQIIRPLLSCSKDRLEDLCVESGVEPVRDPSNASLDFDRVAMRQWLASSAHPFDPKRAGRTVKAMADAAEALNWAAEREYAARVSGDIGTLKFDPAELPTDICRRIIIRILNRIEPDNRTRADAIDRALIDLAMGKRVTLGDVLCIGGATWVFRAAPPRRQ
jgi:tRNA(Ile)-lysidine synthase